MWRGEKRAREGSICSGQELELELVLDLELKRWGLLSANEMAACLHQQPPAIASAAAAASTSAFYSNSMNIWRGEKQREQSNNNNIHMKSNKIKRNETKPNKMKLLPRRHLALHTKIFFHWKHLPGKSCLNLATRTHVCAVGVGTGRGRVGQSGGTRRKTILKDTARSPTSYQRLLSGLVIVFRTCDTIADDIANANADTKTPSSMICCGRQQGAEGGG